MDLLELLRKRGMDGEVDFLWEALPALVEGIMDAEASAQIGAHHGEHSPDRLTHRNGYRSRDWDTGWVRWGGYDGTAHPQNPGEQLLSQPVGAQATQREGAAVGDPAGLCGGRVHQEGGRPDQVREHFPQTAQMLADALPDILGRVCKLPMCPK